MRYALLVTMDDNTYLPRLDFSDKEEAYTWYYAMRDHRNTIATQLLEDGQRKEVWWRDGLSTIDALKALGM